MSLDGGSAAMKTYWAIFDIPEVIIILIGVSSLAWVGWTVREHKEASEKIASAQAWREVLDDPHYTERRRFEERKRVEDDEHQRAATARMSALGH
jgi:predicted negative regulator of RcsB-dependent stress response